MSDRDLREVMLAQMDALADNIITIEAWANELADTGAELSNTRGVEVLRDIVRQNRVQALKRRGQLAALREEYARLFQSEA